jgi:hypothetical protein
LPPSFCGSRSAELNACKGAPGPHDFAVRKMCRTSIGILTPTATRLAFRDDRDTPLSVEAGCANHTANQKFGKAKSFCAQGLTGICDGCPTGKSVGARLVQTGWSRGPASKREPGQRQLNVSAFVSKSVGGAVVDRTGPPAEHLQVTEKAFRQPKAGSGDRTLDPEISHVSCPLQIWANCEVRLPRGAPQLLPSVAEMTCISLGPVVARGGCAGAERLLPS